MNIIKNVKKMIGLYFIISNSKAAKQHIKKGKDKFAR